MGHQDYFLALLPGSIALFASSPESDIVRYELFIMGKTRDGKVSILPSTTRRGTTLNTSVSLDSPSVMSKLLTPPHIHVTRTETSAESENTSDNFDDASSVLDESGSFGPLLDATIARSRQIENTKIPNENPSTPVSSPESREYPSDDLEETYVELNDETRPAPSRPIQLGISPERLRV